MTVDQRLHKIMVHINSNGVLLDRPKTTKFIYEQIKEIMRDQRHACAEAMLQTGDMEDMYTLVFNAEVK